MRLVLFEPEIPPNAGNIVRLCAATQVPLHLIEPLGFSIDDKHLKRAGLDYWPHAQVQVWHSWEHFHSTVLPTRLVMSSSRQGQLYHTFAFHPDDTLVLGPETRGLPEHILAHSPHRVRIPIYQHVRSLNLSTAAGILLYEALRQTGALDVAEE